MTQVAVPASHASSRRSAVDASARFGLLARAFVYLVIGWLGLQIALGRHPHEANQRGALAEVCRGSGGRALVWVLGFGLAAYALWRLSQAAFGAMHRSMGTGERLQSAARGLVYAVLSASTFTFVTGTSRTGQDQQQSSLTARLLREAAGRWLVGVVGVVVVGIGLFMVVDGVRRGFERELRTAQMSRQSRVLVSRVGAVGNVARGIVFAVAGVLVVAAAVTFDPRKSTGLDGALRTLAGHSYGAWLVAALAVGLIAFGCYGLAAARWTRT
jgi:uncharacterized protein DUF1206